MKDQGSSTVLTNYAYILVKLLVRSGFEENAVLQHLQLPKQKQLSSHATMPLPDFIDKCHLACELSGDPLFCLKAGYNASIAETPLFSGLIAYSATFGDALRHIMRYQQLLIDGLNWNAYKESQYTHIYLSAVLSKPDIDFYAPLIEMRLGLLLRLIRCSAQHDADSIIECISFQHKPRAPISHYRAAIDCNVFFNRKFNQLKACENFFEQPVYTANPDILAIYLQKLRTEEEKQLPREKQTYSHMVRAYMERFFLHCPPSLSSTSSALGISSSTLKRRLKNENTSFQDIITDVKTRSAKHYLLQTDLSNTEIARQLGFSSVSAFSRFFRNATTLSPAHFKNLGSA